MLNIFSLSRCKATHTHIETELNDGIRTTILHKLTIKPKEEKNFLTMSQQIM